MFYIELDALGDFMEDEVEPSYLDELPVSNSVPGGFVVEPTEKPLVN